MTKWNQIYWILLSTAFNLFWFENSLNFFQWKNISASDNLNLLIVGLLSLVTFYKLVCIVDGQCKTTDLNIIRTKPAVIVKTNFFFHFTLFPSAQDYTNYSPNFLHFSMFGLTLEDNLYSESVSTSLSGHFPVLKSGSLIIPLYPTEKKKVTFFNKENKTKL